MKDKAIRALLAEAQTSLREGRLADARQQLEHAQALGADRGLVCEGLAHVAAEQGDIPAAAVLMVEASALLPEAVNVAYQASHFNQLAGRFDIALELIDRALIISPLNPALHYARGITLGSLGRYEEEISSYSKAIEIKDDFVDAYVNMGVALRKMQRYDAALAAFNTAIGLNPEHEDARTQCAQTSVLLGKI